MKKSRSPLSFLPFAVMPPRQLINLSIVGLTLFVVGLSGVMAWQSYRDYRANQQMVLADTLSDQLIRAAGITATERGLTSAALGMGRQASPDIRGRIGELRQRGDVAWQTALASAEALKATGLNHDFPAAIEVAKQAQYSLLGAREQTDRCLAESTDCAISGPEWIKASSALIAEAEGMREEVFLAVESPRHVALLDRTMKRWAAVASEEAGLERGILAWHIGARRPLQVPDMKDLKACRSEVDRTTREMIAFSERPDTDARIRRAVQVMQVSFLNEFERQRRQVYAAVESGQYPMDAGQWVDAATRAIDSLLAVSTTVSQITNEYANRAMRAAKWKMGFQFVVALFALGFAGLSLTRVRQTANDLFRQKEMAEITLNSIGDAVITTDAEGRVENLNPVAEEMTGWSNAEAHGHKISEVFHIVNGLSREPEPNPIEACLRNRCVVGLGTNTVLVRRDGAEFVVEDSAAPILDRNGNTVGAVMVFYDVSLMHRIPHLLSYHAAHDALTGLINRREFERRLSELLVQAKHTHQQHALAYLDLDQFKLVNDTCGHAVGDRLLCQITFLLKEKVRDADTLARLGGDEFGLLLENCPLERAQHITEELLGVVRNFRFVWQGHSFDIGVSVGLVPITEDSVTPAEVLSEADAACFAAKEKGRNRVQVYQPGDMEMARRHGEMQWVSRLHKAMDENRFRLHCQTIAPLNGDLARHGEVLLRLEDEDGNLVPPMAFLPAAERYNLMPAIDRWVIGAALATIGEYLRQQQDPRRLMCNINLSGASLGEPGLQKYIDEQLALHQVPPDTICFEITESVAIANLERAATFMHALRQKGCRFALDDFGSGLSSFAYLKTLPVDYLKIDGVFVKDVAHDPVARAMVQAIHTVGHVMGIKTVAEYVENEQILVVLREIGVDYAQGFGIAHPRPMEECLRTCGVKGA
jgi:diguanylate cyclase (GGDEF)-like protein/PAS domain S-box-containing protein